MTIPKEREMTLKRYGKYVRAIDAPKPTQNASKNKGGKRETDLDTPKSKNNFGTSMNRALAIALNNNWHWYGHLQLAKEDITSFDDAYNITKKLRDRLDKQRERAEEKNFAYLIVPDFAEQDGVQKWFLHIWLMNVPNPEKAFEKEPVFEKKIIYHWKKYEKLNGRSELYKIYSSGRTTNGRWKEKNALQIFDIMKRTAAFTPKNKRLYYSSDNIMIDDIIAKGTPSEIYTISSSPDGNPFVKSAWFKSSNLQENIEEAKKYLLSNDFEQEYRNLSELIEEDLTHPELPERQKETFFSYDNYSYEGEYIPPADDNYYCTEPPEDFDYNELNEIYENEVYDFD